MASLCERRASAVNAMEKLAETVQPEWLAPRRTASPAADSSQSHDSSSADEALASAAQPPVAPADSDSSIGTAHSDQSTGCGSTSGVLTTVKQVKQRFLLIHLRAVEAQVLLQELRNGHLGRTLPPPINVANTANANSPRLARVVPFSSGTRVPRSSCKLRFAPASETPDTILTLITQKQSLYALFTTLASLRYLT